MEDPFKFFEDRSKDIEYYEKYPKVKYHPLRLIDLPKEMIMLTTRYGTLVEYSQKLSEEVSEEEGKRFLESLDKHIRTIEYGEKTIKSNFLAEELNNEYSQIIRDNIA